MATEKELVKFDKNVGKRGSQQTPSYIMNFYECVREDDQEATMNILSVAYNNILRDFHIHFETEGEDSADVRILGTIFYVTFESILEKLKELTSTKSKFTIDILDRFRIGFTNRVDYEDEKVGSIAPIIEDISSKKSEIQLGTDLSPAELLSNWAIVYMNDDNTSNEYQVMKKIAAHAKNVLKNEYGFVLASEEHILPIFAYIYDAFVFVIKDKKRVGDETFSLHVFYKYLKVDYYDKTDELILYPTRALKLFLKDDYAATHPFE